MRSCRNKLLVTLLMLVGPFLVQGKRSRSWFNEECDNFEERGIPFYLPDGVIAWERFWDMYPCCIDGIQTLECSMCTDNVLWEYMRNDGEITVCAAVPRRVIAAMEYWRDQRKRLLQTRISKSRNGGSDDSGYTHDSGIKDKPKGSKAVQYSRSGSRSISPQPTIPSYNLRNGQGFQQEMNQGLHQAMSQVLQQGMSQYDQDYDPSSYIQNPIQSYPVVPLQSPDQEIFDTGYLSNILSQLFSVDNPIDLSFNISDDDVIKPPKVPTKRLDCTPPYRQDDSENSNQYPQKEVPQNDADYINPSSYGNVDYPPALSSNVQEQTPSQSDNIGNTNINFNTNTMTVRKGQEKQQQEKQPQRNQNGKIPPKANNRKSKKVQPQRTTAKPESS